ncbi:MAG: hypothetical protein M3O70_21680 [Actinomycetota bacterium]|nr:hypothetical protein [Actinomycetota bacterium]
MSIRPGEKAHAFRHTYALGQFDNGTTIAELQPTSQPPPSTYACREPRCTKPPVPHPSLACYANT